MQKTSAPLVELLDVAYDDDVVLWAERQAQSLREGRLQALDLLHLTEEALDQGFLPVEPDREARG